MLTVVQAPPIRELPSRNALTSSDEHKNSSFLNQRHYYGLYTITSSPPCDQTTPNITHDVVFMMWYLQAKHWTSWVSSGELIWQQDTELFTTPPHKGVKTQHCHIFIYLPVTHTGLFSFRMQVREGGRVHLRINLTKRAF